MKIAVACVVALVGLSALADGNQTSAIVTMTDGSSVRGVVLNVKVDGDAIFADNLELPVELLKSIEKVGTNEMARLTLSNGDLLTLKLDTTAIKVDSLLGKLEIPFRHIRKVALSSKSTAKNASGSVFIGKAVSYPASGQPTRAGTPLVETVNGVAYKYYVLDGEAAISSGIREVPAVDQSTSGPIEIPSSLGGCPVTSLGTDAFYGCSRITSVSIPDTVANIGYCCFFGCSSLQGGLVISDSVVNIEAQAFEHCRSLSTAKIGDNVPELKSWAFYDCPKLRSIEFGRGLRKIGDWSFDQDRALTSVTIPAGVERIGQGAFNGCSSLTEVTMEGSVKEIANRAFSGTPYGNLQSKMM